ncbi:ferritin-like domain-containing protein [Emcibacter sp.]|uniref:ferritin-like domain-containing protein n=1 Tax=Emcibacter sp. TaxID=1979954 RepID=UPI003A94DBB3
MGEQLSICQAALHVLSTSDAREKAAIARETAKLWKAGHFTGRERAFPEDRPARPEKPELLFPKDMPKRGRGGSLENRIALMHAIAHIELNAIDLAWDIVARFGHDMPEDFINDWVEVGDDEARHFMLIEQRLEDLGTFYGELPAHDGLWQAAHDTRNDLAARLAIVPLVLEARGLDVTPGMVKRMENFGDSKSASALKVIYDEEISHVAKGQKWFSWLCEQKGWNGQEKYQELVKKYFSGKLKPPFNKKARKAAGLLESYYLPLSAI